MYLELISIIGMIVLGIIIGASTTYFLMKRKIAKLVEEISAYKRSLKGLWEKNEQDQKVKATKEERVSISTEATLNSLLPTIKTSDLAITPTPSSSKVN